MAVLAGGIITACLDNSIVKNIVAKKRVSRRHLLAGTAAFGASMLVPQLLRAQAGYPARPIRLIVPSAAGGGPDLICRMLGNELALALGQPVVIDNKPGAGGAVGMQELAKAAPDGYTLGYANVVTLAINRSLYSKLPYDPEGFTPVALIGTVQNALVVRNELPVRTVAELIGYARARPGQLNMGSAGNGTTGHLGGELFKTLTGTYMVHIPYRGSPNAIQDLIGGNIDLMFDNLSSIGSHIKAGRVRALGVSGSRRSPLFPDIPTIQESGVKAYETTAWGGIVGPGGMHPETVARLNGEINRLLLTPSLRDAYSQIAVETLPAPPAQLMALAKRESARWADVVRRSGTRLD
jgi:tripartite-type tricarboxylate transporter receptor subunit TctC